MQFCNQQQMKNLLLFAGLIVLAVNANAQVAPIAKGSHTEHRKGLQIAAGAGLGASWISGGNISEQLHYKTDEGLYFGSQVAVGWMFNERVGLFAGVGDDFISWKYQSELNFRQAQTTGTIGESYLAVPIYVRLLPGEGSRADWFADVGFTTSFLYAVTGQGLRGGPDNLESYNKSNTSFFTFTGICIPAGNRVGINVGPRFSYHLKNNFSDATALSARLMSLDFRVTANIRLTK